MNIQSFPILSNVSEIFEIVAEEFLFDKLHGQGPSLLVDMPQYQHQTSLKN